MIRIAPSILSADFSILGQEIHAMDVAGADYIHVDVMDGHFVPNITIGPSVIKALRPHTKKPFDVHLMVSPVDNFIDSFALSGADIITIHPEACSAPHETIQRIKQHKKKVGLALSPTIPASVLAPFLPEIDLILVMTVNPGFGGQAFLSEQVEKIKTVRQMIDCCGRQIELEVDGGITPETARQAIEAGAVTLVAGTSCFKGGKEHYATNIAALRS